MNPESFDTLAVSLQSLVDMNRRLVALWLRKRTLLAAMDLDGLQVVMQSEQELSVGVLALEDSVGDLVSRLLGPELRLHRLGRDVLLRRVIALAPEPVRSRLLALRKDLLDVLFSPRDSHSDNLIVSRRSLTHFREALRYVRAVPVANRPGPFPQEGFSPAAGRAV